MTPISDQEDSQKQAGELRAPERSSTPGPDDEMFQLDMVLPASPTPHKVCVSYSPSKPRSSAQVNVTATPPPTPTRPRATSARNPPAEQRRRGRPPVSQAPAVPLALLAPAAPLEPTLASSQTVTLAALNPDTLQLKPAHRRVPEDGDEKFRVGLATRLAHPALFVPTTPQARNWYVIGRGFDFGVYYEQWYLVCPLVERLKGHGALFKKCTTKEAALAAFDAWEREGRVGVMTGPR